jgi:putative transposase
MPIDVDMMKLKVAVRQIHTEMHANYGSRRMRVELNAQGFVVGLYKVRSLMQALFLKAKRPKQHRYPVAGKPSTVAPNALNRQFNPPMANVNWTGDITYIRTKSRLVISSHRAGFVLKACGELGVFQST